MSNPNDFDLGPYLLGFPLLTAGVTYLGLTAEPSAMWPHAGQVNGFLVTMWAASAVCIVVLGVMLRNMVTTEPDRALTVVDTFAQPSPESARYIENDELIAAGIVVEF